MEAALRTAMGKSSGKARAIDAETGAIIDILYNKYLRTSSARLHLKSKHCKNTHLKIALRFSEEDS